MIMFQISNKLKEHYLLSHADEYLTCDTCSKTFKTRSNLLVHMKKHKKQKKKKTKKLIEDGDGKDGVKNEPKDDEDEEEGEEDDNEDSDSDPALASPIVELREFQIKCTIGGCDQVFTNK